MNYVYLNIPGADRNNVYAASSADSLLSAVSSANKYEEADRPRLVFGRSVSIRTPLLSWQPTHVLTYTPYEISVGNVKKGSPTLYKVTAGTLVTEEATGGEYRLECELCGFATARMRTAARQTYYLTRYSASDGDNALPSTSKEPLCVTSTVCVDLVKYTPTSDDYFVVITCTREPRNTTDAWYVFNYAPDMPPGIYPTPRSYVFVGSGAYEEPDSQRNYRFLSYWLTQIGENVKYVSRIQLVPARFINISTSTTSVAISVLYGELRELKTNYVLNLHNNLSLYPTTPGDNKKRWYDGEFEVYTKGAKVSTFSGYYGKPYAGSATTIKAAVSVINGFDVRLVIVQPNSPDLYIPITTPEVPVIIDKYSADVEAWTRNSMLSAIAGAYGGAARGGLMGIAPGVLNAAASAGEQAITTLPNAKREDITIGSVGSQYPFDDSPVYHIAYYRAADQILVRNWYRRNGYAGSWVVDTLPADRQNYNVYFGAAVWHEARNHTDGVSSVSEKEIVDAMNEELAAGVIVYTEISHIGDTVNYGNP